MNGINGPLSGFWISCLIGCVWESLLCTYDIKGPIRQFLFLVVFLLL